MATVSTWDHACDLLVVGAGGGLAGALAGVEKGLDVLVVEKSAYVGGATSLSGGTLWIMDNPFLKATGVADSPAKANAHLRALVGEAGPAASPERLKAYVSGGHALLDLMARQGVPLAHSGWPDYYSEREGGVPQGRTLHALPFDSRKLGEARAHLRPTLLVVPANSVELAVLALGPRTAKAAMVWARVGLRTLWAKLTGAKLLTRGQALMGRVFGALLKAGVPVWRETRLVDLVTEDGRVTGAVVERDGKALRIQARRGVLLAAGGFARNAELRAQHQDMVGVGGTMSTREDEGDAIRIGAGLGAAVDLMEEAWWVPGTRSPTSVSLHVWDRCFPHAIMVDARGERFVNEADPYMEVGQIMLARQRANGAASWMILESRHRDTYAFGMTPPRLTPKAWFESGYMKKAASLEDLAAQCRDGPRRVPDHGRALQRLRAQRQGHRLPSRRQRLQPLLWRRPPQAEPQPGRDREGAILRGGHLPRRRRHGRRSAGRRARPGADHRWRADPRTLRGGQQLGLGVRPHVSRGRIVDRGLDGVLGDRCPARRRRQLGPGRMSGARTTGRVGTRLGEVAYVRAGQGPSLVLLHGNGHSWHEFSDVLDTLAADFDVVAWDMPGHGDSADVSVPPSIEGYAGALAELVAALNLERPAILGSSVGAFIAASYAAEGRPVSAVVLEEMQFRNRDFWTAAWPRVLSMFGEPLQSLEAVQGRFKRTVDADLLARWNRERTRTGAAGMIGVMAAIRDYELVSGLARLDAPCLLLFGDSGPTVDRAEALAAARPGAVTAIIPDAGHFISLDQPVAFSAAVVGFLNDHIEKTA